MAISDPTEWRALYRAAFRSRADSYETAAKRISEAENAIAERMCQLFRETGVDVAAEREAMDDAIYALRAWKLALINKSHAA